MIEAGDQGLREDLEWLMDRNIVQNVSTSTWPLPLSVLEDALSGARKSNLSPSDVHALLSVKKYIERQKVTVFGVAAKLNAKALPQTDFSSTAKGKGVGAVYVRGGGESIAGRVQINYLIDPLTSKQSKINLEGSYIAAAGLGQVLYAGQISHWWGPGQHGSLIWGNSATAIPGIGLQRGKYVPFESPWLSWIGPWGYDLFVGQMAHDTAVPGVRVLNMRGFFRPVDGLEIGVSRFIQWGGSGRRNGFGAVWDALTGNSNDLGKSADPGNELAGIDIRYRFSLMGNPVVLYSQLAGEDEAGMLPSKHILQIGAQFKHIVGSSRVQWTLEGADTTVRRFFGLSDGQTGVAYRHSIYRNGLYHDGLPIAHFLGGSGRVYSASLSIAPRDYNYYSKFSVRIFHAEPNVINEPVNQAFPRAGKLWGSEVSYGWQYGAAQLKLVAQLVKAQKGSVGNAFNVGLSVNYPLAIM
ncbi:hypothetical protein CDO46_22910 [Pigmentiphaga sp. NML030171]|nr:hypothetical protein CDO46_22910 [Pigmentiphaga sp. NML030171]